jgi:hypothetical protein
MATNQSADKQTARKMLDPYASLCPHDGAFLTAARDACCPDCGQVVAYVVKDSKGQEHQYLAWVRSGRPTERITCRCWRVFGAEATTGHRTAAEAYFHHMASMDAKS